MDARHYFFLLALGLFCRKANAQALNGVIVDADGAPVAYANVYLPALATGDVTDPRGHFAFTAKQLTEATPATPMTVSCIGFRDTTFSLGAFRQNPRLVLAKAAYDLAEVEVRDTRISYGKSKRLGVKAFLVPGFVCMGGYGFQGLEYAVEVKNDENCRLDELFMQTRYLSSDSVLLEINLYTLTADKELGRPLQREPLRKVLTKAQVSDGVRLDISDLAINLTGDFAIAIEVLDFFQADQKGFLAINMPCLPGRNRSWDKQPDGTWKESNYGGAMYVRARCAK